MKSTTLYWEDTPFDISFTYTPFVKGRAYGEPSECYEDEGGEVEIDNISVVGFNITDAIKPSVYALCVTKATEDAREEQIDERLELSDVPF